MGAVQDESAAMFGDDVDVDPALAVDQCCSPDVVDVAIAVCLVLLAVIVKADHRLVIPHVDKRLAHAVADSDLGTRRRQPVVNEDQPYTCFLRRFGSGAHQRKCNSCSGQTARPRITLAQQLDVGCLDAGSPRECVKMPYGKVAW
jgi:hypothetical protein